ncbi:MAG: DNA polymerase III subunit gamma/tau [Thermodesulfobacteriota bacterium]
MAYLVLARKWRPQNFSEVMGQGHVVQTLQNAVRQGRVAHAYLFAGARGVGKTSVARILAKALECESGPTETPCNQCSICREITNGSSVDIYEIDGASNRGIDEIRELRENARYLPAKCRYKIYIIDEVHMLTEPAFNALLKTLEEPPAHVIFIFATTEPHKIPITILSRCQRYDFKRLPASVITGHLKAITDQEGIKLSPGCLRFIAREAEGSMRDALSLLDRIISYGGDEVREEEIASIFGLVDQRQVIEMVEAVFEHNLERGIDLIDRVYTQGQDLKRFYAGLVEALRNLVIIKTCRKSGLLIDVADDEKEELDRLGQARSIETIYLYLQLLLQGWEELRRSSQPRLTLEMILMRASLLKDVVPVEKILEQISILASGINEGPLPVQGKTMACPPRSDPGPDLVYSGIPSKVSHSARTGLDSRRQEEREPGASFASGSPEDMEDFLGFIKGKSVPLASILQQCQGLTIKNDTLAIVFADHSLSDLLRDPFYNARLREICREYYQRDIRIDILSESVAAPGRETAEETGWERTAREEIVKHPLVQEALSIFGGHIEEIKIEKEADC